MKRKEVIFKQMRKVVESNYNMFYLGAFYNKKEKRAALCVFSCVHACVCIPVYECVRDVVKIASTCLPFPLIHLGYASVVALSVEVKIYYRRMIAKFYIKLIDFLHIQFQNHFDCQIPPQIHRNSFMML